MSDNSAFHGMKSGSFKRLIGNNRKCLNALECEHKIMTSTTAKSQATCIDVLEGWAGHAAITNMCPNFGLRALQPADIEYGWDLNSSTGQKEWKRVVCEFKPRLVVMGVRCTYFCGFSDMNYRDRPHVLQQLRDNEMNMVRLALWTAKHQHEHGRLFILENPASSRLWKLDEVLSLRRTTGVLDGVGHGCQYDFKSERGYPLFKPFRFCCNHPKMLLALTRTCPGGHQHDKVAGKETNRSGVYTDTLACVILGTLCDIVKETEPFRFVEQQKVHICKWAPDGPAYEHYPPNTCNKHSVLYLDCSKEVKPWTTVLERAASIVGSSSVPNLDLTSNQDFCDMIKHLVPWELQRVQVSKAPKARRAPWDIPWTHRVTCIWYNDDSIAVESESLGRVAYPRLRFSKPAKIGIFVFGYAPTDDEANEEPPVQEMKTVIPRATPFNDDITFENLSTDKCPVSVRRIVARMHINLAHPSNVQLAKLIADCGGQAAAVAAAHALRCSSCIRKQPRDRHRAQNFPYTGQFNDKVLLDVVFAYDCLGQKITFIGIIDDATLLHVVVRVESRDSEIMWNAVLRAWLTPYGFPLTMVLDQDGGFEGHFVERCEMYGIHTAWVPAEAHHQLGRIERHNAIWRVMFQKVVDSNAVCAIEDVDMAVAATCHAKNSLIQRCGRSPYQATFGRLPRLPTALMSDETQATTLHNMTTDESLMKSTYYRCDAHIAFADFEKQQAVSQSINRKTVNMALQEYTAGQNCAYWRDQRTVRRKGKVILLKPGYVPCKFMMHDNSDPRYENNCFVSQGRRPIKVTYEQLRPAVGFENWCPSKQDIDELLAAQETFVNEGAADNTGPGPPSDEPPNAVVLSDTIGEQAISAEQPDHDMPVQEASLPEILRGADITPPLIADVDNTPAVMDVDTDRASPDKRNADHDLSDEPSSKAVRFDLPVPAHSALITSCTDDYLHFCKMHGESGCDNDVQELPVFYRLPKACYKASANIVESTYPCPCCGFDIDVNVKLLPCWHCGSHGCDNCLVSKVDIPGLRVCQDCVKAHPKSVEHMCNELEKSHDDPSLRKLSSIPDCNPTVTSMSDTSTTSISCFRSSTTGTASVHPSLIAKSTPQSSPSCCLPLVASDSECEPSEEDDEFQYMYQDSDHESDSDNEADNDGEHVDRMTRAQKKAMDREIPWQEILDSSPDVQQAFIQALKNEAESFDSYGSIAAIPDDEAEEIQADPIKKKHILRGRVCYRDKNVGRPPLKAKARAVALGFNDPRLRWLRRFSPTATKAGFVAVMQWYVSGIFQGLGPWILTSADIKNAFLQGKSSQNPGEELFWSPPRDPLVSAAGVFSARLYRIVGNLYGRVDAPVIFCDFLRGKMRDLGFIAHSLDCMTFMFFATVADGRYLLLAIAVFHVDDMLLAHSPEFDISILREAFTWGAWSSSPETLTWSGREIETMPDGRAKVHQSTFTLATDVGKVATGRLKQPLELTAEERTEHRSCTGSGQWLSGTSRPDLSAGVSLYQKGSPTVHDLKALYSLLQYARDTATTGIIFTAMPLEVDKIAVLAFGDSSFANADELKTQTGAMAILAPVTALTHPSPCTVLAWHSHRTKRTVRSTLSGETIAMDSAMDMSVYHAYFMQETIGCGKAASKSRTLQLHVHAVTDCKSLFDTLTKETANLEEKRTLIDIASIRESIESSRVHWVPTTQQVSDGLTKDQQSLRRQLTAFLNDPIVSLRDPEDPDLDVGFKGPRGRP